MEENRFLGNIYGHGAGYAGAVWDKESIAPTLTTMQGGGREPMIVEAEQVHLEQEIINPAKGLSENGWHYEQNLYAEESPLIRTIKAGGGSGNTPKVVEVKQATKDGYIPCDIGGGMRSELSRQYNTQRTSARERTDMSNTNNGEYP